MTRSRFRVTYDIVTPESAENGDTAENGFVLPGGYHVDVATAIADTEGDYEMDLRTALNYVCPQENSGRWFTECDGRENYRTGEHETRSLHPPRSITASSYRRLCKLFKIRP